MAINPESNNNSSILKSEQDKCPKCGSTDISVNSKTNLLRCNFCNFEFEPDFFQEIEKDISNQDKEIISAGAQDIDKTASNIITCKCSSCGAEVVIDTSVSTQAKCHWCRNTLSINQPISNGAIPDMLLPFMIKKPEAKEKMEKFIKSKQYWANSKFKKDFIEENIMGVYFPYMLVDVNGHANFQGEGGKRIKSWTEEKHDSEYTYYEVDLYEVQREFDIAIEGLCVESNSERLENTPDKTNNIINSIMPFDIQHGVKYNSNYLKGYTSEKRNINTNNLKPLVEKQSKDISKVQASYIIRDYNHGVRWKKEEFEIQKQQWKTAYLPVWLYSFKEDGNKSTTYYIAVNARTGETAGSIPTDKTKLFLFALPIVLFLLILGMVNIFFFPIAVFLGIMAALSMKNLHKNTLARHKYEKETKAEIFNVKKEEKLIKKNKKMSDSIIRGANSTDINTNNTKYIKKITNK